MKAKLSSYSFIFGVEMSSGFQSAGWHPRDGARAQGSLNLPRLYSFQHVCLLKLSLS